MNKVWVMSLPVVVTVHASQEPQSWATIIWDNAFSEVNRIPFLIVDRVPWLSMASTLKMLFYSQIGRCLTDENVQYLCKYFFGLIYIMTFYFSKKKLHRNSVLFHTYY